MHMPATTAQPNRLQKGFSLIELLVAITLITFLLLSVTAIFMTFLTSTARSNVRKSILTEGNYALGQIEFMLRNARELRPNASLATCQANMTSIAFTSPDGWITRFEEYNNNNKIASRGADPASPNTFVNSYYLTSSSVELVNTPIFNCVQDGPATFVTISFTLRKTNTQTPTTSETFTTTVQLRNYN